METNNATSDYGNLREVNDFIRFIFFPVGHGSCTLVSFPPELSEGDRIYGAIDCRDATARPIRLYLSDPWFDGEMKPSGTVYNLRFVALTHYHEDHLIGIDHLLGSDNSFSHKHFLSPFPVAGEVARRSKSKPNIKKILYQIQKLAPKPTIMKIYVDCSWLYQPKEDRLKDIFKGIAIAPPDEAFMRMRELHSQRNITPFNVLSSALRFQWGDCSVIIGGDVEDSEWQEIISDLRSKGQLHLLSSNLALCSHHGGNGNPDDLWQLISRCSSSHRQGHEAERRLSRTVIIVPCGSSREGSPSSSSLKTFFDANSLVHCTSPARACLGLHNGEPPSCTSYNDDLLEEQIELLPGEIAMDRSIPDLPPFVSRPVKDSNFRKGSICVDIYPKKSPRIIYHNGVTTAEINDICSCATKLD